MTNTKKLLRGIVLALAIVAAGSMSALSTVTLGTSAAMAQERAPLVASVLFEGNQGFSDAQLLTMVDVATRGIALPGLVEADAEASDSPISTRAM